MSVTQSGGSPDLGRWVRRGRAIVLLDPGPTPDGPVQGELAFVATPGATAQRLSEDVSGFAFNDNRLQPSQRARIVQIAQIVVAAGASGRPVRSLRLVGHTDPVGSAAYNLALGRRRAAAVGAALQAAIERLSPGATRQIRFDVDSRGEAEQVPGGAAMNRRVEVFATRADTPAAPRRPQAPPARPRPRPSGPGPSGLAKEHVIIVGAPTNFYNGFGRIEASTGRLVLNPAPKDLAGVRDFCNPNLGNVTHDLYWANFIEPVTRLFTNGIAKPAEGDVVTLLVYWPPYAARAERDWDSSPWNGLVWRNSPWVAGKDPYDPMVRVGEQGTLRAPSVPTTPTAAPKPTTAFAKQPVSEQRIDHEILMRCTTEMKRPGQTYDMRPTRPSEWLDDVHDLPRRIVFGPMLGGTAVLPAVLVKLLIVDDPQQILDYLAKGTFPSKERWTHVLDTRDESDMANATGPTVGMRTGQWWDATATGKKGFKAPAWWTAPHISRKQIAIKRLDYVGHSNQDGFFLKYGWDHEKGAPRPKPVGEVILHTADLVGALKAAPQAVFSPTARAHLWGCSLGAAMAPALADYVETRAAEVLTDYENIVLDPKNMPSPIGGAWITYVKTVTVHAGP